MTIRPGLEVRPATIADYDRINALAEQLDRIHREGLPDRFRRPDGPNRSRGYIESLIADPATFLAVAELGGAVVGLINCGLERSPDIPTKPALLFLKVRGVVVDEARRRMGIGSSLMAAATDWAAARGASEAQLNVYEFNATAAAFFRGLGFAPISSRFTGPLDGPAEKS
ncbi:MAG: GNAT family N-acetyltransferase [bacterium]